MNLVFGLPDIFVLIGVFIIVVGFALKLDTIFVVVAAGIATGLVVKMDFNSIMEILGKAFVTNRYMTIFILSLPVIGLLEKNGLRIVAKDFISKIKVATSGRIISAYLLIRTLAAAGGLRLSGHVQFIRPLILPMSEGAAVKQFGKLKDKDVEKIKGLNGAVENFANFFGQNGFIANGGVLLIVGTLHELGYPVEAASIAGVSWIMVFIIIVVGTIYFTYHDNAIKRNYPPTQASHTNDINNNKKAELNKSHKIENEVNNAS